MPNYRAPDGGIHFLDSSDFEHLLPSGSIEISEEEASELRKPTEQELAESIRSERDALLGSSDWTMISDSPADQEAWRIYRQALRDITDQSGFPISVKWPDQPVP